jgi:hypothetical protein
VIAAVNATGSFGGGTRPNRTGISSRTPGSPGERIDNYLSPATFSFPPAFTFGNSGRFLPENRGPGRQNWDLALAKQFSITEKSHLGFQAVAFNLLNHPNFLGPSPPPPGTTFGRSGFGAITQVEGPRSMQLVLKLNF